MSSQKDSPLHPEPDAAAAADDDEQPFDPEILALLDFEPVPRKNNRGDAWTPALQRLFIAHLARTGSPGKACDALGKQRTGIDKVFRVASADSFRAAWAAAVTLAQERQAARIAAEAATLGDLKPPFLDNRRVPPGAAPAPDADAAPHEQTPAERAQVLDLLERLVVKHLRNVERERRCRLEGRIVAADLHFRQITFFEIAMELLSEGLGMSGFHMLERLRRDDCSLFDIAETDLSRAIDAKRREVWAKMGEPERPAWPDRGYLVDCGAVRVNISEMIGQTAAPPPGADPAEWRSADWRRQQLLWQEEHAKEAQKLMDWEAQAIADHVARTARAGDKV